MRGDFRKWIVAFGRLSTTKSLLMSPNQCNPLHLLGEGFNQVKDINPAGAFIPVFVRAVPSIRLVKWAAQLLVVESFDLFPRRIVNPQIVFARKRAISHINGNRIICRRDVGVFRNIEDVKGGQSRCGGWGDRGAASHRGGVGDGEGTGRSWAVGGTISRSRDTSGGGGAGIGPCWGDGS